MAYDETVWHLLLGGVIGFVLGYFTCYLRSIKEGVDEVKDELEHEVALHKRDEKGFMRIPIAADIAVLVVVALTAWASFISQKSSHDVQDGQARQDVVVSCIKTTMADTLSSLNQRAVYTVAIADANIDLQRAQREFSKVALHRPPYSVARRYQAFKSYFDQLKRFLRLAHKNKANVVEHPLPDIGDFNKCLTKQ
jgi:hypothetical protein